VILACSSRHVLGLNSCRGFDWWWLRFDVIQDFLDDIWVSDVGDDPHGAAAYWAQGNINPKAATSKTLLSL
jgi:hypothetical protein